jgi:hypothetical protein
MLWNFFTSLLTNLVLSEIVFLLTDIPDTVSPDTNVSNSLATAGIPIPILFGTKKLNNANFIYYIFDGSQPIEKRIKGQIDNLIGSDIDSKRVTVGYKYFATYQIVFSQKVDLIKEIYANDELIHSTNVFENSRIYISKDSVFGGNEKQGGIVGTHEILLGNVSSLPNGYVQSRVGEAFKVPSYKKLCMLTAENVYYSANNSTIPNYAVLATRLPRIGTLDYSFNGLDANPACVVYEILTDSEFGFGIESSKIDIQSFKNAANYANSLGISCSFILNNEVSSFEVIKRMATLANFSFFISKQGLITCKPQKKLTNSQKNGLRIFNDENIIEIENFKQTTYNDTYNSIHVNYSSNHNINDLISLQNLSNINITQHEKDYKANYFGIRNATVASTVAKRDLEMLSKPLKKLTIKVINEYDYEIYDYLKIKSEFYSIDSVFLIVGINFADSSNVVILDLLEDFNSVDTTIIEVNDDNGYVYENNKQPECIENYLIKNSNYLDLNNDLKTRFKILARKPTFDSMFFNMFYTEDESFQEINYCQTFETVEALDKEQTIIKFKNDDLFGQDYTGKYIYLNDEILEIVSIDYLTKEITVLRGAIDTTQKEHLIYSIGYITEEDLKLTDKLYDNNENQTFKILDNTSLGQISLDNCAAISYNNVVRHTLPTTPTNFCLEPENTSYYQQPNCYKSIINGSEFKIALDERHDFNHHYEVYFNDVLIDTFTSINSLNNHVFTANNSFIDLKIRTKEGSNYSYHDIENNFQVAAFDFSFDEFFDHYTGS